MASQLYPKGASHILGMATQVDFATDTFKVLFYDGTFTSTDEFVSDLVAGDIVARSGALSGVTITSGVIDANDITLAAVSGSPFGHLILVKDTGADASSPLIAIYDISTYTPDGTAITVVWNPSGLFSIA